MGEEKMMMKGNGNKLQKSYFDVLGICCSSEVPLVENILKNLDGVKEVTVIVPTRTVIVLHDSLLISQLQIVKAMNQARLEANVRIDGGSKHRNKWPSPYAMASGFLLLISLFQFLYHPLRWVALGAVAVGILPIFLKAITSLKNYRLDTNCLMLIAVIGTIAMNDYLEAGTIVFLFTIAEWLESRASHKANAVMSSLMSLAPQRAVIAETGEEVDVDELKLNTVVAVRGGEMIPIDGIVVDGTCEVDEKTLTGESFPVSKQPDSTVWAGTLNVNGYISVKTTALAEDCVVAKMAKLVEDAQNSRSQTQRFIDKCAQYYTPVVIMISGAIALVPVVRNVHHHRNQWFHLALVVLVSACPCALILSTPVATFCALTKAAKAGLLIKGGDYLETLSKIKAMAFDKTGTITRGEFVVTHFQSLSPDVSLDALLYWVSSIESKSGHPMAAALVDYARSLSIQPVPENVREFQNFPGEGIHGKIDGKDIYIGNRKISARAGSETVPTLEPEKSRGSTIGYVYCGATPAGIFTLSDACRTGVSEAIRDLKQLGIKTAMLTGDSEAAAMHVQEQLEHGLEVVHAELLPEDKARIIGELKKHGPTAMIGDGMNDAPALATADIGISMGISGSALATETGHVILMSNDIRRVPKAIKLARKAHRKVIENVILSISTKAAIVALAIAGHPLVWAAVLADVGTCLLVILNSMLLLKHQSIHNHAGHKHAGKCCKSSAAQQHNHGHNHADKCCKPSATQQHNHGHNHADKCCKPSAAQHNHGHNHAGKCCKPSAVQHGHNNEGKCCKPSAAQHDTDHNQGKCCKPSASQHEGKCCKSSAAQHDHNYNHAGHKHEGHKHEDKCCKPAATEHDHDHNHAGHNQEGKCCKPAVADRDHDHTHAEDKHEGKCCKSAAAEHSHDHNHAGHNHGGNSCKSAAAEHSHDHNHAAHNHGGNSCKSAAAEKDHDHDHNHAGHNHEGKCCKSAAAEHYHDHNHIGHNHGGKCSKSADAEHDHDHEHDHNHAGHNHAGKCCKSSDAGHGHDNLSHQSIHNHEVKSCKSSVAEHNRKHGQNNLTHSDNQGCCNQNVGTMCDAERGSCATKCQSSLVSTNLCTYNKADAANEVHEVKPCCHGGSSSARSCTKLSIQQNQGCSSTHSSSSCGGHECETEVDRQDNLIGIKNLDILEVKCSHHTHCGDKASDCPNEGEIVALELLGDHSGKCCKEPGHAHYLAVDIPGDDHEHHPETKGDRHGCMSLGHRGTGGCCKSYRKECCGSKHGQFAGGFGHGSLSEIIIKQ